MSNVFYGHQATFTGPQTTFMVLSNIKIRGGVWSGMTAGQSMSIVDLAGKTFVFTAPSGDDVIIGPLGWIRGLSVPTLPSGNLNLYLDK